MQANNSVATNHKQNQAIHLPVRISSKPQDVFLLNLGTIVKDDKNVREKDK